MPRELMILAQRYRHTRLLRAYDGQQNWLRRVSDERRQLDDTLLAPHFFSRRWLSYLHLFRLLCRVAGLLLAQRV